MFDQLENRVLMSTVTLKAGKIRIEGTSGNDSVQIARYSKTQGQVIDSGNVILTFQLNRVTGISFNGGDGNDLITIGRVNIKSYLVGGNGNDSLSCSQGNANDTIFGNDGSDYLYGGDGNDSLNGGLLDDTMLGGKGNDTLVVYSTVGNDDFVSGGDGKDVADGSTSSVKLAWIIGPAKPDPTKVNDTILGDVETVIGSAFNDKLTVASNNSIYIDGGAGNDVITTSIGNDTVIGGAGKDSIITGAGNDTIRDQDGQTDTVNGGEGVDSGLLDSFDVKTSIDIALT